MSDMRPTITASTADGFAELEKMVDNLPKRIVNQLENVTFSFTSFAIGTFRERFEARPTIVIPNNTKQITYSDVDVTIITPEWMFKYPLKGNGNHSAEQINFVFINLNEDKI